MPLYLTNAYTFESVEQRLKKPLCVKLIDPFQCLPLNLVFGFPGAQSVDNLCFEQADHRFSKRVFIRVPAEDVRHLRSLATAKRQRVDMLTTLKAQTARARDATVKAAAGALIRQIQGQIDNLDVQIAQALEAERFREKAKLLGAIKRIGPVATVTLIAEMPELGTLSSKQVAALTGLVPRAHDSGNRQGVPFIQDGGGSSCGMFSTWPPQWPRGLTQT